MIGWSVSHKEALILRLLLEHGDLYGLELVEHAEGELKRGTVYVTLSRMADKGLVEIRGAPPNEHAPGLPRPRYRLTTLGRRALAATELVGAPAWKGARS